MVQFTKQGTYIVANGEHRLSNIHIPRVAHGAFYHQDVEFLLNGTYPIVLNNKADKRLVKVNNSFFIRLPIGYEEISKSNATRLTNVIKQNYNNEKKRKASTTIQKMFRGSKVRNERTKTAGYNALRNTNFHSIESFVKPIGKATRNEQILARARRTANNLAEMAKKGPVRLPNKNGKIKVPRVNSQGYSELLPFVARGSVRPILEKKKYRAPPIFPPTGPYRSRYTTRTVPVKRPYNKRNPPKYNREGHSIRAFPPHQGRQYRNPPMNTIYEPDPRSTLILTNFGTENRSQLTGLGRSHTIPPPRIY